MNELRLHHVGIVVKNIENYLKESIFIKTQKKVYDPIQDSNLALVSIQSETLIELIEPASKNATTYNFLNRRGEGFHHLCFEIKSFRELDLIVQEKKIKLFWGPTPAILFNNKEVVFGYTKKQRNF